MSWQRWLETGAVRVEPSDESEYLDLLEIADRDLQDAAIAELSPDRRFATAYNAILQMLTLVVRSHGYRVAGAGHHARTIQVAGVLENRLTGDELGYFDLCRRKRNLADYDAAGRISEAEAARILTAAQELRNRAVEWMNRRSDPPGGIPPQR